MKLLSEATENTRNQITMLAIINIHEKIEATTTQGGSWEGTLRGYDDDCLLVDENDENGICEWPFEALKTLTVEKSLDGQGRVITLPGDPNVN